MASVGTWQAPGGKLTMDPKTHNVIEPVYLRTVVKSAIDLQAAVDLDDRHLQGARRLGVPGTSAGRCHLTAGAFASTTTSDKDAAQWGFS